MALWHQPRHQFSLIRVFPSTWRKLGPLVTYWVHSKDSDQTGWMPRLIWVFAWCTPILLALIFFILSFIAWLRQVCASCPFPLLHIYRMTKTSLRILYVPTYTHKVCKFVKALAKQLFRACKLKEWFLCKYAVRTCPSCTTRCRPNFVPKPTLSYTWTSLPVSYHLDDAMLHTLNRWLEFLFMIFASAEFFM